MMTHTHNVENSCLVFVRKEKAGKKQEEKKVLQCTNRHKVIWFISSLLFCFVFLAFVLLHKPTSRSRVNRATDMHTEGSP